MIKPINRNSLLTTPFVAAKSWELYNIIINKLDPDLEGTYKVKIFNLRQEYLKKGKVIESKKPNIQELVEDPSRIIKWKNRYTPNTIERFFNMKKWNTEEITIKKL